MVGIVFEDLDLEEPFTKELKALNPVLQLYLMFLYSWQKLLRISTVDMNILFRFIALFLVMIANILGLQSLLAFASTFPKNVAADQRLIGRKESFHKWVSCQKCNALYSIQDAKTVSNSTCVSKLWSCAISKSSTTSTLKIMWLLIT